MTFDSWYNTTCSCVKVDKIFSYINEHINTTEPISWNGSMPSFLHFILSQNLLRGKFSFINKYIHTGIYSTINNPSDLRSCEYTDEIHEKYLLSENHKVVKTDKSYIKNLAYAHVEHSEYIYLANRIRIIEISYGHSDTSLSHAGFSSSLVLIESNLLPK